jgi:trk system potassium uptake protein TrkH
VSLRSALHYAALFAIHLAAAMLIPALVEFHHGSDQWENFLLSAFFTGGLALAVTMASNGPAPVLNLRFAFLIIGMLWIVTCLAGMVPLLGFGLSFSDALFESTSAVTTTGATILSGLDALPPGILLWRSLLQWMGGVGVIVLGLFLLPFLQVGGISHFRIDPSGISEQPFARLSSFGIGILLAYTLLTLLCGLSYVAAGMGGFAALNHAMTTVSTAGYSIHDESFAHYLDRPAVLWVGSLFMFIGALPFSILILLALRRRFEALDDPQLRAFALYSAALVALAAIYLHVSAGLSFSSALTLATFNFMSVVTTTGFSAGDYSAWGPFPFALAFLAMFLGGCSGSTSGGIKAYRLMILIAIIRNGVRRLVYPSSVNALHYGNHPVSTELERAVVLYIGSFLLAWMLCMLMLAMTGMDFLSALSGSLSALMNVGPGLGEQIGPASTHASISDAAKWLLALAMLLGRLEILPVLVLVSPVFWRR